MIHRVFLVIAILGGVLILWQCADNQAPTSPSNHAPQLAPIGAQSLTEGDSLCLTIQAIDVDGTVPSLNVIDTLDNSTFVDNHDGTASFCFQPDSSQIGSTAAIFVASDGQLADTLAVALDISEPINHPPEIAYVGPQIVDQDSCLELDISATDADGDSITLQIGVMARNLAFEDYGDGTGLLIFCPDSTQLGTRIVPIYASDEENADTLMLTIMVNTPPNQPPELQSVAPQVVHALDTLELKLVAIDPDGDVPFINYLHRISNSNFADHHDGTATLTFFPAESQVGEYSPMFIASDGELADTLVVDLTVEAARNRAPVFQSMLNQRVTETDTLRFTVSATDPEGTVPHLGADFLPANATFTDNGDGTGSCVFTPTLHQAGDYLPVFTAFDGELLSKLTVPIHVADTLNSPPVIVDLPDTIETWEAKCCTLQVRIEDPEGDSLTLLYSAQPKLHFYIQWREADTWYFQLCFYYGQAGAYDLTFIVFDNSSSDFALTRLIVHESERPPVFYTVAPKYAAVRDTVVFTVRAYDPDLTTPELWGYNFPENTTFVLDGNGGGSCTFVPEPGQEGDYEFCFVATDGIAADTQIVEVHVLTLGGPRQDGPIPCAIGNIWSYHSPYSPRDRMFAIVDYEMIDGEIWWVLSSELLPLGNRFMMRGDTVFCENGIELLPPGDTTYCYPAPELYMRKDLCVTSDLECTCSPCVRYYRNSSWDGPPPGSKWEYYDFCPGVGLLKAEQAIQDGLSYYEAYKIGLESYHLR